MINHIVLEKIMALCESIVTVDFEGTGAGSLKESPPETEMPPLT